MTKVNFTPTKKYERYIRIIKSQMELKDSKTISYSDVVNQIFSEVPWKFFGLEEKT